MAETIFAQHAAQIRASSTSTADRLRVYLRGAYTDYMERLARYYEWVDSRPGCAIPTPSRPDEALIYLHLVESPEARELVEAVLGRLRSPHASVKAPAQPWGYLVAGMLVTHAGLAEYVEQVHRSLGTFVYPHPPPEPGKQAQRAAAKLLDRAQGQASAPKVEGPPADIYEEGSESSDSKDAGDGDQGGDNRPEPVKEGA